MRRSRHYLAVLMGLWALVGGGLGVAAPPDHTLETKRLATRSAVETAPKTGSTPTVGKADDHAKGRLLVKLRSAASVKVLPMALGGAAVTDEEVLAKVRSVKGFKAMRPQFTGALVPSVGQRLMARDGKVLTTPDLTRWHRIDLEESEDVLARVAEVKQIPGVEVAEPDYIRRPALLPDATIPDAASDPLFSQQWHLAAVHAPEAWAYLKSQGFPPGGSRDVIVAVVDTGIDMTHPDLAANLWTNSADGTHGYNAITGINDPTDDNGHGTHVAGIIAAQGGNGQGGVGIAFNVQIMAIKSAQYSGGLTVSDIANGVLWAVAHGADVINMSFGGYGRSQVEEDALAVAFGQAVLVAAAGNDGLPNQQTPEYPKGRPMYPACYSWVLGVMASYGGGGLAAFSNWDIIPKNTTEYELMAPGVGVWSAMPKNQYAAWSGTSMSAPVVSGIAALVRTKYPDKSTYSSRFIMGQVAGAAPLKTAFPGCLYHAADALEAVSSSPKPDLSYLRHWVFDTSSQGATNNSDGVVDAGETIDLGLEIRNHWGSASAVSVKLEPTAGAVGNDPYVTMISDTVDYGAVGPFGADTNGLTVDATGAINGVARPFRFSVNAATPNEHIIPFKVTITARNGLDSGDSQTYTFASGFVLFVTNGKTLPKIITEDMTLSRDSLWVVPDATLIEAGATVRVAEGTKLQFYSSYALGPYAQDPLPSITVRGKLDIQGSAKDPVRLVLADSYRDRVVEIKRSLSGVVDIKYAVVENPCMEVTSVEHAKFNGTGLYATEVFLNGAWVSFWNKHYLDADLISKSIFYKLQPNYHWANLDASYPASWPGGFWLRSPFLGQEIAGKIRETLFTDCRMSLGLSEWVYDPKYPEFTNNVVLNNEGIQDYLGNKTWTRSVLFFGAKSIAPQNLIFTNNAILSNYNELPPSKWTILTYHNDSDRIPFSYQSPVDITNNYWGTQSVSIINARINDFYDNFNKQKLLYQPILSTPAQSTYPFVSNVTLYDSGSHEVTKVGAEAVRFSVVFNRNMDQLIQPEVSFGPAEPFTDFTVSGAWQDARTWVGSFVVNTITGDGIQGIRINGAQSADDSWLVTGEDKDRFRFEIATSGTASMNLQASGGEGKISLGWTQNDVDLLAGYHLYRSTTPGGTYSRVNGTIIPPQSPSYTDVTVVPGASYWYKFTVVKTDLTESQFSNVATATPLDTVPPVISHYPASTCAPGLALSLSAQVTDNVAVQGVQLHFRRSGTATYVNRSLTHTYGNTYAITLEGSLLVSPGLDYYLVATDGITSVNSGRPESPYQVVVVDQPTVTSLSPVSGPAAGSTRVNISGTNFKAGATVTFGGAIASSVTVLSANQITCATPAHIPVAADVVVTNPDSQVGTFLRGFTFESDTASLSIPTQTAGQNSTVQVPISAATIQGMLSAEISVTYDSAILRAKGASTGSLTAGWALAPNIQTPGLVRLGMANATSVTGAGTLAVLEFEVLGAPGSSTSLGLASVRLNNGAIPLTTSDGTLNVQMVYSISGGATHWKSGAVIPGVQMQATGDRTYTGATDNAGAYSVAGVPPGSYTLRPSKTTDANGITAYDASLVLQHTVGLVTLTGSSAAAADVDKSGTITPLDAAYILQQAAGLLVVPFPGAGIIWEFSPPTSTVNSLNSNLTNQNFTGLLLGDVSGNWASTEVAAARGATIAGGATVDVRVAELGLAGDGSLQSTLSVGPQGQAVYSLDLILAYDATKGTPRSVVKDSATANWMVSSNLNQTGEIRVSMASANPISTDAVFLGIKFDPIGGAQAVGLTIKEAWINETLAGNVQYAVTVTKVGDGSGTVTSAPAGLSETVGQAFFNAGTPVTLTAVAAAGSSFGGWSGAASGSGATAALTLDAAKQVVATFSTLPSHSISGSAGVAGALLTYTDGTPKTVTADGSGVYSLSVSYNWSGTVTPSKSGYTFSPVSKAYTNVLTDQAAQSYTATAITYNISGNAGVGGATLSYTDGSAKTATADGTGAYSFSVSYSWSGTVTPSKTGYSFSPVSKAYTNILADQTAQNYSATAITYTISGNAGVAGATLSYTDGSGKTATADGAGAYSFPVSHSWSGTVTPSKAGYTFSPVAKTYTNVLADQAAQTYTATAITYTISGNAGVAGATLSYTDGSAKTATTDGTGAYSFTVSYSWSGTVTPSKTGYSFSPVAKTYANILTDQTAQNYTATAVTYTISGNAGVVGVTLSYTDGTAKTATADGTGAYSFSVSYGWSGTVTPSKSGYSFSPATKTYNNVLADQVTQNYSATAITYTISGNAGVAGATLSYTDGSGKTATADGTGAYSFTVSYSWSGTVTPSKAGYSFSPVSKTFTNVLADQAAQTYTATAITYTITGNAGVAGATLSYTDGSAKTATADGTGAYSFPVSYSWSGAVTPSKLGYTFSPVSKSYTNVLADQSAQAYTATPITCNISGNAGVAGATLSYTDGAAKTATADGTGAYSITVSYSWSGSVTPSKTGYSFSPTAKTYTNIISDQTTQNFTAAAITYTISGNAGVAGATLSYTDGTAKTTTADGTGAYSLTVSYSWSGTVTLSKTGYTFTPATKTYATVLADQVAQDYTARAITYAIYGKAGVAGATLSYTDGTAKTATADGTGAYTFTVSYSWSGTVTPTKTGYTFSPVSKTYNNVLSDQTAQTYTATAITYTISGNAGVAGATLGYTDGSAKTATADGNGAYSFTVSYSWSGTVTPSKTGYSFSPVSKSYTNVLADQAAQTYTATAITYTISGNAGVSGATLSYTDGSAKTATADGTGAYSFPVSFGWSGTVTPTKTGYTFSPVSKAYTNVLADQTAQTYSATAITYTISGNAGVAGATLSYTDGSAKTATADGTGAYSFTVSYSWSGTVTPSKTGYSFSPVSKAYTNLLADQTAQTYTATAITYTISGNAGVSGATLSYTDGSAKTATADGTGAYSFTVSYSWSGTVTPTKTGYGFSPVSRVYANVLANQTAQNYTALGLTAVVTWDNPAAITYGTALGNAQLNATADRPGTFAYTPALGTVLNAGTAQALSTTFTPTDAQYQAVTKTVHMDVAKAAQTLSFSPVTGLVAGGSAATLQASATSGLPVTFSSSNPAVLAISGSTASPLSAGSVVVTASQAGDANHLAAPDVTQTLIIAANPGGPTLTLSMLSDGATTPDRIFNISGQVHSPNGMGSVTVNAETVLLASDGSFQHALRLVAGSNTIAIHAADAVGHTTDSTRSVTLDEGAPKVTITTPTDNAILSGSTVHVTGQVVPAGTGSDPISTLTYSLGGGSAQTVIPSGTSFAFDLVPPLGLNSLELTATTVAGKRSQAKLTFTLSSAFALAITDPAQDLLTTLTTYLLKGTISGNSTPVAVIVTMGSQQYTPTVTNGIFQQTLSLDSNKLWPVIVSGTDGQNQTLTVRRNIFRMPEAVPAFTSADATAASRFISGASTPTPADLSSYDMAPVVKGGPVGDGRIDVEDLVVIFRKAMGLPL